MSLLRNEDITNLVSTKSLLKNFDQALLGTSKSPIRNSSLDLTVGGIYLPGRKSGRPGGPDRPLTAHVLGEGECAVLKTAEIISMPTNIGAIGFPPSTEISLSGVLTTNPGHIDPGYEGPLHLTVINMGKSKFALKAGERVMRVLLFQTDGVDTGARKVAGEPIDDVLLGRLAKDFLNIEKRAKRAANNAVTRGQILVPLLVALLTLAASGVVGYFTVVKGTDEKIANLQAGQSKLEGEINPAHDAPEGKILEKKISSLKKEIDAITLEIRAKLKK